jgi:HAMP domain-containing protein
MILSVLVGILIGIFAARSIVRPVKTIVAYVEEVANGNLSERSHNIATQDEIRQLADAIVKMTQNLRNLIRQINSNAEQLAASSEELTASAEQSAQASNQVAVSMTEVAAGANAQLTSATDASAVVEEMSAGIEQIAANAGLVAGQSEQAREKAKDGGMAVDKAVQQMSRIEQTVNSSATVVAKLGERSKEIGQIVDAIAGIAGQTNLLALNAAIEAARAGGAGTRLCGGRRRSPQAGGTVGRSRPANIRPDRGNSGRYRYGRRRHEQRYAGSQNRRRGGQRGGSIVPGDRRSGDGSIGSDQTNVGGHRTDGDRQSADCGRG